MSPGAESLVFIKNERDKLMKAFETRLSQFELRMQLLLEKQPKCECLSQKDRVLEVAINLETQFSKISQQMLSNNVMQKKLLKHLEILNESELLKHNRASNHGWSISKDKLEVYDFNAVEEPMPKISRHNVDLKESSKREVSEDGVGSAENCSVQSDFQYVGMPPLVIPPFQNKEILFDRQKMHESNDDESLEEKSVNDTVNALVSISEMPFHKKTHDPHNSFNDPPVSINKPCEINLHNPCLYLPDMKHEIVESNQEMSWPTEMSSCNEPPCYRNNNDNTSLTSDIMQFKSEVIQHKEGVVLEIQAEPFDQSINVVAENSKFNQLTTSDQSQSGNHHYQCERCDGLFFDNETFKRHMKMQHPDRSVIKRHKCELCSYSSNELNHLKVHLRVHTKEKPFQCTICLKRFTQKSHLKIHSRIHTRDCFYQCNKCGKKFTREYNLKIHSCIHTKECSYECNKCDKKFTQLGSLRAHIRMVHDKRKSCVCNVCGFSFGRPSDLKKHMSIHTGARNYKCQYCDKRFTQSSTMRRHERIHTGEKRYICKECSATFTDSSNLRIHVFVHHSKGYPYKCYGCEKGFVSISEKQKHEHTCQNN